MVNYKYFIGYLHDDYKINPLHIMLPETRAYVKTSDGQTKWMYFLIDNDNLLEKYNTIWDKVPDDITKYSDSKPVYKTSFLATKIRTCGDGVTDFYNKEIPKVDSNYTSLEIISLDTAHNNNGNYYLQVLLKEGKYIAKKSN